MNQQPAPKDHHALVATARGLCQNLSRLLADENEALRERKIEEIEENLKLKKRLGLKLEKVMADIRAEGKDIRLNPQAMNTARALQEDMADFQNLARQNVLMLKAAHQARADFLDMVRLAIQEQKPNAQTYNQSGSIEKEPQNIPLMNKEI